MFVRGTFTSSSVYTLLHFPLFFCIILSLNCVELVTGKAGITEVLASDLTEVLTGNSRKDRFKKR